MNDACIAPGELVLDIGAGTGAITQELVAAGARVIAVELHPRRAALLRARFAGQAVVVVEVDASALRLPGRPFKVVANPPFGRTTSLLRHLISARSRLDRGVLVLPAWAAARWAAGRGVGGITSKQLFSIELGPRLPTRAFRPPPPGDARMVLITRTRAHRIHRNR